jgi:hypothetical protein
MVTEYAMVTMGEEAEMNMKLTQDLRTTQDQNHQ